MNASGKSTTSNAAVALLCASAVLFLSAGYLYKRTQVMMERGKRPACAECHVKSAPVRGDSELLKRPLAHPEFKTASCPSAPSSEAPYHTDEKKENISSLSYEPDVVVLKEIVEKYGPVDFSHKKHADMAQMSGGCWSCHHNSPAGRPHPACKTCHAVKPDKKNPSVPRLKAAYHRHCIDCHKLWSHNNSCDVCHEKKSVYKHGEKAKRPFPPLKQPQKIVYNTKHSKRVVTFFHNIHTDFFKIPCENCHSGNTCADCHDRRNTAHARAPKAGHKVCSGCHDTVDRKYCESCHRSEILNFYEHNKDVTISKYHPGLPCSACHHQHKPFAKLSADCRTCHKGLQFKTFDHEKTGFSLKKYHASVECRRCHPDDRPLKPVGALCSSCHKRGIKGFNHAKTGYKLSRSHAALACSACHGRMTTSISKPPRECSSCHRSGFKGIDHARAAGFEFDDIHASMDCENCHPGGYGQPPDCESCHGQDRSYPKDKPGK